MKKLFTLLLTTLLMSSICFSQGDLVSKKGTPILPEPGEYSIGINAAPFFNYLGNLLNSNQFNNSPGWGFTADNPMNIVCKRVVNENTAYRAIFRFGITSMTDKEYVSDDYQSDPLVTVEDIWKNNQVNISLGMGIEKNRGKGRLKGIYGLTGIISLSTNKDKYEYGNAYSTSNIYPTRTFFGMNSLGYSWVLEEKWGTILGIRAIGFVGAEYFFAPKLSLSGEFSYGLRFESEGDGEIKSQSWDNLNAIGRTSITTTGGRKFFGLDTGVVSTLNLNFYF